MGNRAVITTEENFHNNGIGIYLHYNGGRDSVEPFLTFCKLKHYTPPEKDCYGWACLCNVLSNWFENGLSVGIGTINTLDCNNRDNGVYIIKDWEIIDRKYFSGKEQNNHDFKQFLHIINSKQPINMAINPKIIDSYIKRK